MKFLFPLYSCLIYSLIPITQVFLLSCSVSKLDNENIDFLISSRFHFLESFFSSSWFGNIENVPEIISISLNILYSLFLCCKVNEDLRENWIYFGISAVFVEIDISLSKGAIMDKSDKYWSCSDKESLCLRGDSNLFHLQAYFLCL